LDLVPSDVPSEPALAVPYRTINASYFFDPSLAEINVYYSVFPYTSQTAPPVHTRQIKFHNNVLQ
jgi:hypothetical protein